MYNSIEGDTKMIDKTQKIKGKNISMKIFKTKLAELESHGFQIPANLKHLKKFELEEFVLTNKSQTKFIRLWGDTEKSRFFSVLDFDFRDGLCFAEMNVIKMLTDDEYENGVTYDELVAKNKKFMISQINDLSKQAMLNAEKNACHTR